MAGIAVILMVSSAFVLLSDTSSAEDNGYPTDTHRKYTVTFEIPGVENCAYYTLDFGDGTVIDSRETLSPEITEIASTTDDSTTYIAVHTYPAVPGTYTMVFTAHNSNEETAENGLNVTLLGYPVITFEGNGGSGTGPLTVVNGADNGGLPSDRYYTAAEKPADPVREGFTFTGWYTDEGLSQTYDWSAIVYDDLALYAGWTETVPEYTAVYYVDGTLYVTQTYGEGDAVVLPDPPSKEGFVFKGWKNYTDGMTAAGNMGFCAVFESESQVTVTVSYTVGGVTYSTFVESGGKFVAEDPVKEGYTFCGWYTDEECTQEFDAESVTEDATIYPKFTEDAEQQDSGIPVIPIAVAIAGILAIFAGTRTHPAVSVVGAGALAAGAAMGFGII